MDQNNKTDSNNPPASMAPPSGPNPIETPGIATPPTPTPVPVNPSLSSTNQTPPSSASVAEPKVIDLKAGGLSKVFVSTGSHKKAFLLGALAVFLLVGLGASLFMVRQQQDIRSKAASNAPTGCDMRWPADPATDCGKATQQPKQDATDVSLTPDFHWDYGGYRPTDNNQCVQPSGCSDYQAYVLLFEGSSTGKAFAQAAGPSLYTKSSTPVKDVKFSDFRVCDYGNIFPNDPNTCHTDGKPNIGPLKPNTDYYWFVQPYFGGIVHVEQAWKYHFKTGASASASCQMVSADKDLAKIQIGDTVKFTGYGSVSSDTEKIDKINFILTKDGTPGPDDILDTVRAPDKDSGGNKFYVATASANISSVGNYTMRIKVHWLRADGTGEWKE